MDLSKSYYANISTSSDHFFVLYSLVLDIPGIFLMLFEVSIRRKILFCGILKGTDNIDNGRFFTRGRIIRQDELGQTFVCLCVSSVKTGTRRIIRLDEVSFEIRLERRTMKGSSSGRIMRLVPVFIVEMQNQTNYKLFAEVRPDG